MKLRLSSLCLRGTRFLLLLLVPAAAMGAPATEVGSLPREQLAEVGIEQRLGQAVPTGLVFTDANGRRVRLGDLLARKPTVLALVYYECPNLCTLVLNGVVRCAAQLRQPVGDGFQIVAISIDPSETPQLAAEKKATYLRRYGRAEGHADDWHFLVGDAANIRSLAGAVGYGYRFDPASGQFAHGSGIMVLDATGRITQYLLGIEYPPDDLAGALARARQGEVANPVSSFLLLCYSYNPLTGPYGSLIAWVLRGSAFLTVAALGAFVWNQLRRERRGRILR